MTDYYLNHVYCFTDIGESKMINENLLTWIQIELVGWVHFFQWGTACVIEI